MGMYSYTFDDLFSTQHNIQNFHAEDVLLDYTECLNANFVRNPKPFHRHCDLPPFNYYWENMQGKKEMYIHLGYPHVTDRSQYDVAVEYIDIDLLSGKLSFEQNFARYAAWVQYETVGHHSRPISKAEAVSLIAQSEQARYIKPVATLEDYSEENIEKCLSESGLKTRRAILAEHQLLLDQNAPLKAATNPLKTKEPAPMEVEKILLLSVYHRDTETHYYLRKTQQGYRLLSIEDPEGIRNRPAFPEESEIAALFQNKISGRVCDRLLSDADMAFLNCALLKRGEITQSERLYAAKEFCIYVSLLEDGHGEWNRRVRRGDEVVNALRQLALHTFSE